MKKILFTLFLGILSLQSMQAQEVFNEVVKIAKANSEDTSKTLETRKVATFQMDALSYMAMKVRDEVLADTTSVENLNANINYLNEQSLAMYKFVTFFVESVMKARRDKDKELVVARFKKASLDNPYFNDTDKELTLAYFDKEGYITQFSLDTDWQKALQQVRYVEPDERVKR